MISLNAKITKLRIKIKLFNLLRKKKKIIILSFKNTFKSITSIVCINQEGKNEIFVIFH